MHPYEFVSKFKDIHIKGLKISFRKKWVYFCIITFKKYWNKVYWPIWIGWVIATLITYILKAKQIESPPIFTFIKYVLQSLVYLAIIPVSISLFHMVRWRKWENNHGHLLTQRLTRDLIDHVNRINRAREEEEERVRQARETIRQQTQLARQRAQEEIERARQQIERARQEANLLRGDIRDLLR